MVNENTAQVKAQLIQRINKLKPEAISRGFDYPTQLPEDATIFELIDFLVEITTFIGYEVGYNDSIIDAEFDNAEPPNATH